MQLNRKISSFTLSEMMVVLVISAIVISLAITVLNLVQQQISSINSNFRKNAEVRLLERTLYTDFNKHKLSYSSKDSLLICANPNDTVFYKFNHNYVLRNKDTLHVQIAQMTNYLDAQVVKENTIDALSLTLSNEFQNKQLFIFKQKDAAFYMNTNGF